MSGLSILFLGGDSVPQCLPATSPSGGGPEPHTCSPLPAPLGGYAPALSAVASIACLSESRSLSRASTAALSHAILGALHPP